ncbi:hypothetical protein SAY87_003832 [Trapa incisa]|uniref:Uncharacterized protein n=2 Tax=Trapa TaxID=22665 RepID=A0AAN7L4S3_TRANT|nr:hypothetical protein SAY87_003832 [Trapa incisa]KAK4778650.1 hypothetical protein SAY86_006178 [Trapa natans]
MSPVAEEVVGKSSKIRRIVRLRQMLLRWRRKAHLSASAASRVPDDVPAGHVAVCVGASRRRFVVRAVHLNHPVFQSLLLQAEEEYGFANRSGPLEIPCDEAFFQEVLRHISGPSGSSARPVRTVDAEDLNRCCKGSRFDIRIESRPLLDGPVGKTAW